MTTEVAPPIPRSVQWKALGIVACTCVFAAIVYLLLPASMGELQRRSVAIFIIAAVLWATEVLPLFATSLCVIGIEILLLAHDGGLAPSPDIIGGPGLSAKLFLDPFANSVIILFMGGFLLSRSVTKHGLDQAIAARLLSPLARGPLSTIYAVMGITAFFSMWMSNTATTAMMLAIVTPLLATLPEGERFKRAIVLAVPVGANVGGIGTPIGTPPNAVAFATLRQAGYSVTFLDWMIVAVPLAALLLAFAGLVLYVMFKPTTALAPARIIPPRQITAEGYITLAILVLSILLWVSEGWHGISAAVVALIAAALLTALRVLNKHDVDSIDWNILLLMWGGLSLGVAMEATGLVNTIVSLPIANQEGLILAGAIVLLSVGLSTFMSNTAAANLIIPMALGLSASEGGMLVVLTALACSMAMAMPISTPPNAMAFATGQIDSRHLMKVGTIVGIAAIFTLLAGYQIILPWMLG